MDLSRLCDRYLIWNTAFLHAVSVKAVKASAILQQAEASLDKPSFEIDRAQKRTAKLIAERGFSVAI